MNLTADIQSAADTIRRYLERRPGASDTLAGVARFWVAVQRYNDSLGVVQAALDALERDGVVVRVSLANGEAIYRRKFERTIGEF